MRSRDVGLAISEKMELLAAEARKKSYGWKQGVGRIGAAEVTARLVGMSFESQLDTREGREQDGEGGSGDLVYGGWQRVDRLTI